MSFFLYRPQGSDSIEATTILPQGGELARHPGPVMILARLAVDQTFQGKGLGHALLKDALRRTLRAADIAGIRAVLVHAKDGEARQWYRQFDFKEGTTDPFHLFLVLKDLKALLGE